MRKGQCSKGILHLELGVYVCAHVCTCMCMCVLGVGKAAEHLSSRQSSSCPALDGGLPRRWAGVWGLQPFPEAPPTTAMTRHQLQAGRGPLPGTPRDPGPLQSWLKGKRAGLPIPATQQHPGCGDPLGATTSV